MRDFLCRPVLNGSIYQSESGGQGKTSMFTYEEQVAYQAQFEESNQKVAEEYLGRKPGEPLFMMRFARCLCGPLTKRICTGILLPA